MDLPFIARNYSGMAVARFFDIFPSFLQYLRSSNGRLKPFVARRLRGSRIKRVETVDIGGLRMCLDLSDDVQRDIYLQLYEPDDIQRCSQLIRPGAICFDVGANVGFYSLHLGKWAGAEGRVYSFEPSPQNFSILQKNIELNSFQGRIEPIMSAVAAETGTVSFNVSLQGHSGWGSVNRFSDVHAIKPISVPAITLDAFVAEREIVSVDFLKIDVESFEFEVLAGARECIRKKLFQHVFIEWTGGRHTELGHRYDSLVKIFTREGYIPDAASVRILDDFKSGVLDPQTATINLIFSAR